MQSPDGLSLYFASNRSGGEGGLDIWVAHRPSTSHPWHTPVNLGTRINSTSDELCPTPVRGKGLFFISAREGAGDIYFARLSPAHGWTAPVNLGSGVNSSLRGRPVVLRSRWTRLPLLLQRPGYLRQPAGLKRQLGVGYASHRAEQRLRRLAAERPQGRSGGRVRLQPRRLPGWFTQSRHMDRDASECGRSLVNAHQPRQSGEHRRHRGSSVVLLGRQHALLQPLWRRQIAGHLGHHAMRPRAATP